MNNPATVPEPSETADPAVPAPPPHPAAAEMQPPPILEMRQVAGLTAGSVMDLHVGSFQFSETEGPQSIGGEERVGFSLIVRGPDDVAVVPGATATFVDDVRIEEATALGQGLINVGSACFTVRPPRQPPTGRYRLASLEEARLPAAAIEVPEIAEGGADHLPLAAWPQLQASIVEARNRVADRHRALHPDPEQLKSRLDRMDPGLWDRGRNHPMFGRFALAYSTIPWEPRFDAPERIPTEFHQPIHDMGKLPWVPVTANLLHGPVGIVGPRPAVLAAARSAVVSLACLSHPDDIAFSIVTAKGNIDAWSWSSALPDRLFPDGSDAFPVAVADGMVHFEGAGFEHEAVLRNELGLIVLGESLDELPEYCATVVHIAPDGRAQVTNHLGEQVLATPIGITVALATDLASSIHQALVDETLAGEFGEGGDEHLAGPGPTGSETADDSPPTRPPDLALRPPAAPASPDRDDPADPDDPGDETDPGDEADLADPGDEADDPTTMAADDFVEELNELFGAADDS